MVGDVHLGTVGNIQVFWSIKIKKKYNKKYKGALDGVPARTALCQERVFLSRIISCLKDWSTRIRTPLAKRLQR